ncbi:MAG: dnaE2 [Acidobacteriaceae bacterium]|nr:dnaE2 [Acidobacteriaceae bacterium]
MYIELHARSAFSFLEGASQPEALAAACAHMNMPAMALLDRDGVYGAPRFHMAAKKLGVKAHIGSEVTVRNGGAETQSSCSLLAESRAGYQNLCRLITRMKLRAKTKTVSGEVAVSYDDLAEYASGLICLTGGEEGPLAAALKQGGMPQGRKSLEHLVRIFGRRNVYVELQRHFDRSEESRNQAAVQLAREFNLPVLATNGVRYATPPEREMLDALTCIRNHTQLETAGRLLAPNSERHLRSVAQMSQMFADIPEAIANTQELSSRLEFTLADLGYQFPRYPVPAGETMMSFLRAKTQEGARERYRPYYERARQQIERELALIERLDLAGYFLIVWDLVRFCREERILVQGRGSAANSAVCYALGITAIDPVGMELLFERFLSEERGEWPDIDLDLPSGDQRERVIQYLYRRYGTMGAAMTANVITYRGRSAAREMGKVLGFDAETLDRLSKLVGTWEWRDPADTLERNFHEAGFDLRHPRIARFMDLCIRVRDLPRHLGQHSGGMVICQGQLDSVVPLEPASMPGRVVVQWDKDDCADLGIIKVDLLGLGMMAVLEDSISLIRDEYREDVDLAHLPQDDPKTYDAIQKADTVGMFQIESRAQMASLPRNCPQKFYDLVVQVALIRPGPIVGQMVNPYMKRRQGRERVMYPHPSLEPVLARTLGVPLFQEQLLRMAMICANFSGGEAEELRRALGSRRSTQKMKEIETKLRAGMEANGIDKKTQDEIVLFISSFALYGFPESHAASFALIAYASAYLKCNYLAAFTAALLNNQPMGFYHPATIVKDAQRHGLRVLPVDVMRSEWQCTLEGQLSAVGYQLSAKDMRRQDAAATAGETPAVHNFALRLGLRYVRGLREEAGQCLVRQRGLRPFESVDDLARRVPELQKKDLVMLAQIGALNSIAGNMQSTSAAKAAHITKLNGTAEAVPLQSLGSQENFLSPIAGLKARATHIEDPTFIAGGSTLRKPHRRDALWDVERVAQPAGPLLAELDGEDVSSPLAQMTAEERLVADFHGTGVTVGPHPMTYHRARLIAQNVYRANELPNVRNGKYVRVAGSVIARQRPGTASGFIFLSLEDESGIANVIITPDIYDRNRMTVVNEKFLLVEGTLQNLENVVSVKAEKVSALRVSEADVKSHDFH